MPIKDEGLKSFIVFGETWAGVSVLTEAQRGRLFQALYAKFGFAPEVVLDQATKAVYAMMMPRIEESMAKYIDTRNKRKEAGKVGGSSTKANAADAKQTEANGSKAKQTEANQADAPGAKQTEATPEDASKTPPITTGRSNRTRDISSSSGFTHEQGEGGYSQERDIRHSDPEPPQETSPRPRAKPTPKVDLRMDDFKIWYQAYPRHKNPGDAEKAWVKGIKEGVIPDDLSVMLEPLEWQRKQPQWQDPNYIPFPATYLNKKAWLEEPDKIPQPQARQGTLPIYGSGNGYGTRPMSREEATHERNMQTAREVLAEMEEEDRRREEGGGYR